MELEKVDYILKIVIVGESDVGKTSLMLRLIQDTFNENTSNTIGVEHFLDVKYTEDHSKKVKLSFWDTAGQERFRSLTSAYYKDANGIILVYDVSDRESFNSLQHWHQEVKKNSDGPLSIAIVGNKEDLDQEEWMVSQEEGKTYAEKINALFSLVSAKTNAERKVDLIVDMLMARILEENVNVNQFKQKQVERIRIEKECLEYSRAEKLRMKDRGKSCC